MRLLLDTHVLIWLFGNPTRIPAATLNVIRNSANEILVSAVSPFEIATKHRIGKFPEGERVILAYEDHMRVLGASELAITGRHGIVAGQLPWEHRDPFDRILAAQSVTEGLELVTSDAVFGSVSGVRAVWG